MTQGPLGALNRPSQPMIIESRARAAPPSLVRSKSLSCQWLLELEHWQASIRDRDSSCGSRAPATETRAGGVLCRWLGGLAADRLSQPEAARGSRARAAARLDSGGGRSAQGAAAPGMAADWGLVSQPAPQCSMSAAVAARRRVTDSDMSV